MSRAIDHAVAEFEPDDCTVHTLTGRMRVDGLPYHPETDTEPLIPVHAYEFLDHSREKIAFYAGVGGDTDEFRVQGSYSDDTDRNIFEQPTTFSWRVEVTNAHVANVWLKHDGNWYRPAHNDSTERTSIRELDTMTEIQSNDAVDNIAFPQGRVRSEWTGCYTEEYGWTTPRKALRWSGIEGPTGDHDGDHAQLNWLKAMESGHFVFEHFTLS